jgi:predicted amidohydrolase
MRVYLPRFFVGGLPENLARMEADVAEAASFGSEMIVFPELFLTGYHGQSELPLMHRAFAEASASCPGMLCVFGAVSEDKHNRLWVYLAGDAVTHYDKVHLFRPNGEHTMWQAGQRYCAVEWGPWRIGLMTCNDVRFSEQARALKLRHDINLLVCPALWPWERDDVWATLLHARAIENGMFAVGCCVAGVDNGKERLDGAGNHVFDPLGDTVRTAGRLYELDPAILDAVLVDTRAQHVDIGEVDCVKAGG